MSTTKEILDAVAKTERANPSGPAATNTYAAYATTISSALPHIAPAVIGEVLLHAADLYGDLRAVMRGTKPATQAAITETGFTVGVLVKAGEMLYNRPAETSGS